MSLGGPLGHEQPFGYLSIREALRHQPGHLVLSCG
jgi:hypothetical protein